MASPSSSSSTGLEGDRDSDGQRHYSLVREKLYTGLLMDIAQENPAANQEVIRELTLRDVLCSSSPIADNSNRDQRSMSCGSASRAEGRYGVLGEEDILRFGISSRPELGSRVLRRLEEELDRIILSISDFFHAGTDVSHHNENEVMDIAWILLESIKAHKDDLVSTQTDLHAAYGRIEELIKATGDIHLHLHEGLCDVLSRFPPVINSRRSALNDLRAATIETSLIKLSLIRARAHQTLYDYTSPNNPRSNMRQALSAAHARLKKEEEKMREEERTLNCQVEEYETLLRMVDGGEGGFTQVVKDWTKVQSESEECRRDLRRLGWAGD